MAFFSFYRSSSLKHLLNAQSALYLICIDGSTELMLLHIFVLHFVAPVQWCIQLYYIEYSRKIWNLPYFDLQQLNIFEKSWYFEPHYRDIGYSFSCFSWLSLALSEDVCRAHPLYVSANRIAQKRTYFISSSYPLCHIPTNLRSFQICCWFLGGPMYLFVIWFTIEKFNTGESQLVIFVKP